MISRLTASIDSASPRLYTTPKKQTPREAGFVCGARTRSADHALLAGALDAAAAHAEGEREPAPVQPRIARQDDRRGLRIAREAELAFTDDLRAAVVLHDVAARVGRMVGAGRQLLAARRHALAAARRVDRVTRGAADSDRGGVRPDLVCVLVAALADEARHRPQPALYQPQERIVVLGAVLHKVVLLDLDLGVRPHREGAAVGEIDLSVAVALGRQYIARVHLRLLRQDAHTAVRTLHRSEERRVGKE